MKNIKILNYESGSFKSTFNTLVKEEVPFIIRNFNIDNYQKLSLSEVNKQVGENGTKEFGWYVRELDLPQFRPPEFIKELMESGSYFVSEKPFRTFMQPNNHHTLAHYDGNSLHGFNLQVRGRKYWRLISPVKALKMVPFMYVVMDQDQVNKNIEYEFETSPGDLLFLPRYWIHDVSTKEEVNLNFNWVLTPKVPKLDCYNGRREAQIVKLRQSVPLINKIFFPDDFRKYGGGGKIAVENYTEKISFLYSIYRLFKEISHYLSLPFYFFKLKKMANEFKDNNFNIQDDFRKTG